MRILTASGVGALVVLCVLRRHDLATAAAAVPPQVLGALAALHLCSLVARSEAWRLSLAALAGAPPSRVAIHAANAGAFVAGALEAHAALPARVALLRRLAPHQLPHPTHVAVADLPILLLEAAGAALLLGATGAWWAPAGAVALLVGARLVAGRRATRGLAVLTDVRRRAALALLVGCIVGCGLARVWLVLAVAHLDASPWLASRRRGSRPRTKPAALRSQLLIEGRRVPARVAGPRAAESARGCASFATPAEGARRGCAALCTVCDA